MSRSLFSSCIRIFRIILIRAIRYFVWVLATLVPVKKCSVCFSMKPGLYNSNSKYLFEYLSIYEKDKFYSVWLADNPVFRRKCSHSEDLVFVKRYSILGLWRFLRSEIVFLSHGFSDFGLYSKAAKRKTVVQLWHGIGIKYMGLLDQKNDEGSRDLYLRNESKYYNLVVTSSDLDRYYTASYMGVDVRKVLACGLPRNDALVSNIEVEEKSTFDFLYAPTFRDNTSTRQSLFFPFSFDFDVIEHWALENNVRFFMRPHPNDQMSIKTVKQLENRNDQIFIDASQEKYPDVISLIKLCSGIITDYSSIFIDGLLLDLPCAFVDFDRASYIDQRGLAYDYELVTPGPKVQDWEGFKRACEDMSCGASEYNEKRQFVRSLFFNYEDGGSCKRVAEATKALVA